MDKWCLFGRPGLLLLMIMLVVESTRARIGGPNA